MGRLKTGELKYGVAFTDILKADVPTEEQPVYWKIIHRWHSMLKRCYSEAGNYPTYEGVRVCDEWLTFSNFKNWIVAQPGWEFLELDKDILLEDNKIYSPESCVMLPSYINKGFNFKIGKMRGSYDTSSKTPKWTATCIVDGKQLYLGRYFTKEEAYEVWKVKKLENLVSLYGMYKKDEFYIEKVRIRLSEIIVKLRQSSLLPDD